MQITTIGFDVAKNVFQVHGIDEALAAKFSILQARIKVEVRSIAALDRNFTLVHARMEDTKRCHQKVVGSKRVSARSRTG